MILYHLIIQAVAPERCLEICRKFGDEKPAFCVDALVKIATSDCYSSVVTEFVDVVVIPFLAVLKVLQKSGKHKYKSVLSIILRKEQELLLQESTNLIEIIQTKNFQVNRT